MGRKVVVLDGEDDFVAMLRHMLHVLGMESISVRHGDYRRGDFDGADLVIVGPGPGDPRDLADHKIATVRGAVDSLLESGRPFLAVCLGHQVLCGRLGIDLSIDDFDRLGANVPLLVNLQPAGKYLGEEFHRAGGVPAADDGYRI